MQMDPPCPLTALVLSRGGAALLGAYLSLDEAVRVVLSAPALYRGHGAAGDGARVLLKAALLSGGCPPHLRTRCVAPSARAWGALARRRCPREVPFGLG